MTTEAESPMPAEAGAATEVKLPQYEIVAVISPDDDEEQLESRVNYISQLITDMLFPVYSVAFRHQGCCPHQHIGHCRFTTGIAVTMIERKQ